MRSRVVVLLSGSGTNLQALLDAPQDAYEVVGVISDRPEAAGIARAVARGIPTDVLALSGDADRVEWDQDLAEAIGHLKPDWVVCAGFMRVLGPAVITGFPLRIVNTHPALLPSFPGAHGVRDALAYGVTITGCTVHLVDSGVDTGPIVAQHAIEVDPDDDEATLHERIKVEERKLLVDVVTTLCAQGCTVTGRKVSIP